MNKQKTRNDDIKTKPEGKSDTDVLTDIIIWEYNKRLRNIIPEGKLRRTEAAGSVEVLSELWYGEGSRRVWQGLF